MGNRRVCAGANPNTCATTAHHRTSTHRRTDRCSAYGNTGSTNRDSCAAYVDPSAGYT